jgi:hypothetical protein
MKIKLFFVQGQIDGKQFGHSMMAIVNQTEKYWSKPVFDQS